MAQPTQQLTQWLIKKRIVKSPIQANYLLLIVLVASLVVMVLAVHAGTEKPAKVTPQQSAQFQYMNRPT